MPRQLPHPPAAIDVASRQMRRRPPVTVVAYIAVITAIFLAGFIAAGAEPRLLVGAVAFGAGAVGLYFGVRIAWILVTALQTANLLAALLNQAAWWMIAILIAQLALLLAPPTRRYFRREPPRTVSRTRRVVRFVATGSAALLLGLVGYAVLFPPDPVSGDLGLVRSDRPGLRVLFVGNTLTSDNSMTRMIGRLGQGDQRAPTIFAVQYARRGSRLDDALDDSRLTDLLEDERWDQVVLQEHSQVSSRPAEREAHTLPAAMTIDSLAGRGGAQTVLFMSWGYEHGDRDGVRGDSYQAMQARLSQGSFELAARLPASLAPVGLAWEVALRRLPQLELWGHDGRRPSEAGSYLTACVFYALLTHRDPTGSRFTAGLDPAQAQSLQQVATESVRQIHTGSAPATG
jgi:hypothetical protein